MTDGALCKKRSLKGRRLRRNREFQQVFGRGSSVANHFYVLYVIRKPDALKTRVGFSVSRKVGNAVVRNRVKRVLREVVRLSIHELPAGCDCVLIARKDAAPLAFAAVERHVRSLFRRAGLLPRG